MSDSLPVLSTLKPSVRMATVPVLCEGNSSPYDNKTWLEKVKDIVELNGKPFALSGDQSPLFKQGDCVIVRFRKKGRTLLFKGTVNYLSAADDKEVESDASTENVTPAPRPRVTPGDGPPSSGVARSNQSERKSDHISSGLLSSDGTLSSSTAGEYSGDREANENVGKSAAQSLPLQSVGTPSSVSVASAEKLL